MKPRRRYTMFVREAFYSTHIRSAPAFSSPSFLSHSLDCSIQVVHSTLSRHLSLLLSLRLWQILSVKDNSDHETATRAHGDLFAVSQVVDRDLEAVAAGAWVCVSLQSGIVGHVLVRKEECQ
jgi:hypothetical protein